MNLFDIKVPKTYSPFINRTIDLEEGAIYLLTSCPLNCEYPQHLAYWQYNDVCTVSFDDGLITIKNVSFAARQKQNKVTASYVNSITFFLSDNIIPYGLEFIEDNP